MTFTHKYLKARGQSSLHPETPSGWVDLLPNRFYQEVSGTSSIGSRRRQFSPGALRVQQGAGVLLGTPITVDARLLGAAVEFVKKQAVVVTGHDPAVFCLLWVELVMEGELGDVAGPGGNPSGLLL